MPERGGVEDVNEAIAAVLDGSAGTARTVFRLVPAAAPSD